jgi:hypothetical protein
MLEASSVEGFIVVRPAHTLFNQYLIHVVRSTEWTIPIYRWINFTIEFVCRWAFEVKFGTWNLRAFGLSRLRPNVESEEPVSTVVGGESPLSLPDFEFIANFT